MIKVYCDNGGFNKELRALEKQGIVEVLMFPYENRNTKTRATSLPSNAQFRDLNNFDRWDDLPGTFGDYTASDKYASIEEIVGGQHRRDVLHLDSAYKSGCSCLFTSDKDDIYANREALFELLDIKIYLHNHSVDWEDFLAFVDEHRELASGY